MLEKYLSFYVWQGMSLMKNVSLLKQLPTVTKRLLLSFTASDYRFLATSNGIRTAKSFITKANMKGIRVELLIGEPTLALPLYVNGLQSMLQVFRSIPFDGVQLDIERDQLASYEKPLWDAGIVTALASCRMYLGEFTTRLVPIGVTVHHRELAVSGFQERLHKAGTPEVTAMYYASNPLTVFNFPSLYPDWKYPKTSLAVSIEKNLSAEESTFERGRIESLEQWQEINSVLGYPVTVQSFEDYMKAEV